MKRLLFLVFAIAAAGAAHAGEAESQALAHALAQWDTPPMPAVPGERRRPPKIHKGFDYLVQEEGLK